MALFKEIPKLNFTAGGSFVTWRIEIIYDRQKCFYGSAVEHMHEKLFNKIFETIIHGSGKFYFGSKFWDFVIRQILRGCRKFLCHNDAK